MLYAEFVPILEECFALPGFPGTKALIFGFQDIDIHEIFIRPPSAVSWKRKLLQLQYRMAGRLIPVPAEFQAGDLGEVLKRKGAESVDTLDLFDQRANLRFDMNTPVAAEYHELYDSIIDLGSLEH